MADRAPGDADAEILRARTRALAAPPRRARHAAWSDALTVRVSGERYAIDPIVVHGVLAITGLTPLPHAPAHVAGLIVHAGAVLPAFHLGGVLDLPLGTLPEVGQVVLLGADAIELALVVEAVIGVRRIDLTALAPAPQTLSRSARSLIRGIDPEGVPLLDGRLLLDSERLIVDFTFSRRGE